MNVAQRIRQESDVCAGAMVFIIAALLLAPAGVLAQEGETPPTDAAPVEPEIEVTVIADPEEDRAREALAAIIASDHRSEGNRARDRYRHPLETLLWFGLRDDMPVAEITPGGGWYLEVIAPFLRENGTYYAVNSDAETWWPLSAISWTQSGADRIRARLGRNPEVFDRVNMAVLLDDESGISPDGTVDLVLTFRNVHNWMMAGTRNLVFEHMYRALRPGGVLGVVEHRGDPDVEQDPGGRLGYVREDVIIGFAEAAGFEFVRGTDINNNPNDRKDYGGGVWTLPPTLARGDEDREEYLAIGESDRATLMFRKPEA